jgi:DNA-binding IscR family transcriptional regulator
MPDEDRFLLNLALKKGITAASIREIAEETDLSEVQVTATLVRLFARLRR